MDMMVVEELTIPVPWGQIAVKLWGSSEKPRVLAIHGLNDNAASFDQLMPLLESQLHVVCVDLPGHGLSSHFPAGLYCSILDYVCALKRVVEHLHWTEFSVLAHSFGSHIAIYFTAIFGQSVFHVLLIDAFFAHVIPGDDFILERCQLIFDKLFMGEKCSKRKYQYEDSLKKLFEDRQTKLRIQNIIALQKRAFRKTTNGFTYNNDQRIKLLTYPLITMNFHLGLIKRMDSLILVISTSEFEPLLTPTTKITLAELTKNLGWRLRVIKVKGSHDIHMERPQSIAHFVKNFFSQHESHL